MLPVPQVLLDVAYPTMLPVAILSLILATLLCGPVGRRLRTGPRVAWLLLASVGGILALTIAPSREALTTPITGPITCDFSRLGLAPLSVYARFEDPFFNIVVFVPLGFAIGLLPTGRPKLVLAIAALMLPLAIETTQAVVVAMGRACQSGDVFDNGFGALIGLALGLVAFRLTAHSRTAP
ncbi:MAG TPA: VanZ family protein [Candidatus Limnocylindrales bacterium]